MANDIFDELEGMPKRTTLDQAERNRLALGGKKLSDKERQIQDLKLAAVEELSTPLYEQLASAWDVDSLVNAFGSDAAGMVSALGLSLTPKKVSKSAALAEAMQAQDERGRRSKLIGLQEATGERAARKQDVDEASMAIRLAGQKRQEEERLNKFGKAAESTLSLLEKKLDLLDKTEAKFGQLSDKQTSKRDTLEQKIDHGRDYLANFGVSDRKGFAQFKSELKAYEVRKKKGDPTYGR